LHIERILLNILFLGNDQSLDDNNLEVITKILVTQIFNFKAKLKRI